MALNASSPEEPTSELRSPLLDLTVALIEDSVDRAVSGPPFRELGPTAQMRGPSVSCASGTSRLSSWSALLNVRGGSSIHRDVL